MIDRTIFRFKNPEVQKRYREILEGNFTLTERSKVLFEKGEPGQGYVYFLDLTTLEIDLIPAWNPTPEQFEQFKKDPAAREDFLREKKKNFEYEGEFYGVLSEEPAGSATGVVHKEGMRQINKVNKGGVHGLMLGGGIFKDDLDNFFQFRDKSTSQNKYAIEFNEIFFLANYEPGIDEGLFQRSIPSQVSQQIADFLLNNLPADPEQHRRITYADSVLKTMEDWFINASDEEIKNNLQNNLVKATMNNDVEIIKRMIILQARFPGIISFDQLTETAISFGAKDIALLLIKKDIGLSAHDFLGKSLLMLSIPNYPEISQALIEKNIDLKISDTKGNTALMYAIAAQQTDLALEILKKLDSSSINTMNKSTQNALSLAIEKNDERLIQALIPKGADLNLALYALAASKAAVTNPKILSKLYELGADLKSALKMAREKKHSEAISILEQEVKHLENFENYKNKIQQFIDTQLTRLPKHDNPELVSLTDMLNKTKDPKKAEALVKDIQKKIHSPKERQYMKRMELETLSYQVKNCKNMKALENLVDEIKKVTAVHHDTGMLGFFKFTHFRDTTSRKAVNDIKIEDPAKKSKKSA